MCSYVFHKNPFLFLLFRTLNFRKVLNRHNILRKIKNSWINALKKAKLTQKQLPTQMCKNKGSAQERLKTKKNNC